MNSLNHGAWAANLTPLTSTLKINHAALSEHIHRLLSSGCSGVALFGTTGEANSFTIEERVAAIGAVASEISNRDAIMVGTGCCAVDDSIRLSKAALSSGFHNFLMLPPFYYKGVSDDGIFQAFAAILRALPEKDCNVTIYDIPHMSGVPISIDLLERLRDAFPDIVVGVKNSRGDWDMIAETCRRLPDFNTFAGTEKFLLQTLRAGGAGCISATANVTSPRLGEIASDWRSSAADALQDEATNARIALEQFPAAPVLKEIMARRTGDNAWRNIRPPFTTLNNEQQSLLDKILATVSLSGDDLDLRKAS